MWAGLAFGLVLIAITPPFQGPDEFVHFFRAAHIAEGHVRAQVGSRRVGAFLPQSLYDLALMFGNLPFHTSQKITIRQLRTAAAVRLQPTKRWFVDFPSAAITSPVPYLPQAAGLACGRLLGLPPLYWVYLGRLANLLGWLALIHAAIRLTPAGKWCLVLLAFMPMSISQSATMSYDAMTSGAAFLLTAMALALAMRPSSTLIAFRELVLFGLVAVLGALTKQVVGLLALLLIMVPSRNFGSWRRKLAAIVTIMVVCTAAWWAWYSYNGPTMYSYGQYNPAYRNGTALFAGTDPHRQLAFFMSAPLSHLVDYAWHVACAMTMSSRYLATFVAGLGWLDVVFPVWFICGYFIALWVVAWGELAHGCGLPTRFQRVVMLGNALLLGFIVCLFMTIYAGCVGTYDLDRVQGRYFIPLAPVLFLAFSGMGVRRPGMMRLCGRIPLLAYGCVGTAFIVTITTMIRRYYIQ